MEGFNASIVLFKGCPAERKSERLQSTKPMETTTEQGVQAERRTAYLRRRAWAHSRDSSWGPTKEEPDGCYPREHWNGNKPEAELGRVCILHPDQLLAPGGVIVGAWQGD
ncbi:hypothetical protein N1851_018331 [Merluccius polli]|uniref:Uncharacterized protein n=1 Tax=Merluccius polli TaxID=89951 RepID=A0AA47P0H8_MERPO|nr:hypothetical protein N1851_018331 [Merluccius polli]